MRDIGGEIYYSPIDLSIMFNVTVKTMRSYIHRGFLVPDLITVSDRGCKRYKFKQKTVDEFAKTCHLDAVVGERVLYTGDIAAMCGISTKSLQRYLERGDLVPDVILPRRTNGRAGWSKFTERTANEFVEKYKRGEFHRARRKKNV